MQIPIFSLNKVQVKQKNENVLKINNFDIHRGACYVFEGRMGSGKTTFLESLYNRKKGERGEIKFEEKDIHKYSNQEYQDQISIVPQSFNPPWGTVRNYIRKTI